MTWPSSDDPFVPGGLTTVILNFLCSCLVVGKLLSTVVTLRCIDLSRLNVLFGILLGILLLVKLSAILTSVFVWTNCACNLSV